MSVQANRTRVVKFIRTQVGRSAKRNTKVVTLPTLTTANLRCAGGIDPGFDQCPKCGATMDEDCKVN